MNELIAEITRMIKRKKRSFRVYTSEFDRGYKDGQLIALETILNWIKSKQLNTTK